MTHDKLRVGVFGAGGYTGSELIRLLHAHPRLQLSYVAAKDRAGQRLGSVLPNVEGVPELMDLPVERFEAGAAAELRQRLDVVFSALPHGASASICGELFDAGLIVVDLSADFRLKDLGRYRQFYGEHPRADLLTHAVYGLPELHRSALPGARLIAAPGCYPTSAVLPLAPLLRARLIESDRIVIDSKSGVSGAGRAASSSTHFAECSEGLRPYKVAGTHRHVPEIEQELSGQAGSSVAVVFTPQLVPLTRGILTCAYGVARPGTSAEACRAAARELYGQGSTSGLVTVLDAGRLPDTLWVRGSARALVAYELDAHTNTVIAMCAEDNLAKGASAQAIQALNVSLGWPETLGLPVVGQFP